MKRITLWLGVCAAAGALAVSARAQSPVAEVYLFSTFGGNPGVPPFSITSSDGVQLFLNGSGIATSFSDIDVVGPVEILYPLTYASHSGTINSGEVNGTTAAHVNAEIGEWDDVGVVNEGADDALLNIDYGDDASVTFTRIENAPCLIVAEDAGLDPFKLEFDDGSGFITLFDGFDAGTQAGILARADFGSDDSSPDIDQVYVFLFAQPLSGAFRISETTNPNSSSTRLEVDFVGACIPEPNTALLVAGSFGLLGLALRQRRRQE